MRQISIIIPTLNEAEYISKTIEALRANRKSALDIEITVVDTGSTDGTPDVARQYPITVKNLDGAYRGRAEALNFGAREAKGDVLLFLDADSIVPRDYDYWIQTALMEEAIVGGAFEFALDGVELGLRFVEWMNRLRYRVWPRYYGDQGIFVYRDLFQKVGGYPLMPILEASHFCQTLSKHGKLKLISRKIYTSPRRFYEGGIYRVFGAGLKIWWLDLMGFSTNHFAQGYWEKNTRDHHLKGDRQDLGEPKKVTAT